MLAGVAEARRAPGGCDDAFAVVALEERSREEGIVAEAVIDEVLSEGEAGAALVGGEEGELVGVRSEGRNGEADEADRFGHRHAGPDGSGAMKDIVATAERGIKGVPDGMRAKGSEADCDGDGGAAEAGSAEAAAGHFGKLEEVALDFGA